ncbi:hypothetical protein BGW36DRAFT_287062 [Talaromyces proteolyticus]|uniref:Zn(2)-C6 fungal-type domain-containing protein n=1 Tax=Talaromyces proteolyticus TaxID=1131652 RepID=A0AAD4L293_9EURO|nr:uncharacterized protein BGW36DRAFT_287062 [Talaromyces proteolyticus]KAH8703194.1 hypothetical protein BGW36DRAFT_287062 [Talaromyces proteolyticus]
MVSTEKQCDKERRVRTSHPKVRTGCLTCKRRHKKCDENRPSCRMCISSGRECEGYCTIPDKRTKAARRVRQSTLHIPIVAKASTAQQFEQDLIIPVTLNSPGQVDLTQPERWHLNLFRNYTARHCGGYFHDEFWHGLVHQLSEEQPAVRHAVIAMSARHIQFERVQLKHAIDAGQAYLSLQQCNKSIACLRQYLSKAPPGSSRNQVVLTTCVVLVCLALFEEDTNIADYHFQSGYRLLQEWQKENFSVGSSGPAFIQTFSQLQIHRSTCADPKTFVEDDHPSLPSPDVENSRPTKSHVNAEAVNHFIIVLGWVLLRIDAQGFNIGPAITHIRNGEGAVLSMLRLWRTQLKRSITIHGDDVPQSDRDALTLFALWSEVIYIKLFTSSEPEANEMRYDKFLAHFQRAVVLAKSLITPTKGQSALSIFPSVTSIVPPLLFCGFKCRDWLIRRQVTLLLRELKGHEDIWVSGPILALERMVEIESEGIGPGENIPEASRVDSMSVVIDTKDHHIFLRYHRSWLPNDTYGINDDGLWQNELLSVPAGR